jgi:hypothetical protein
MKTVYMVYLLGDTIIVREFFFLYCLFAKKGEEPVLDEISGKGNTIIFNSEQMCNTIRQNPGIIHA